MKKNLLILFWMLKCLELWIKVRKKDNAAEEYANQKSKEIMKRWKNEKSNFIKDELWGKSLAYDDMYCYLVDHEL